MFTINVSIRRRKLPARAEFIAESFEKRLTRGRQLHANRVLNKKTSTPQAIINEISVNISEIKYLTADDDKKNSDLFRQANRGKNVTFKLTAATSSHA